jgi:uncharacterized membrane protein YfcA
MDLIAILSGFGIGAIVGMTGVGGGSLMTPLLLSVFKLNPAVAISGSRASRRPPARRRTTCRAM